MAAPVHRFLARGPGQPMPEDDFLLTLVPSGVAVPFELVFNHLLALRQDEVLEWFCVTPDIWGWALAATRATSVSTQIADAINRRVLVCFAVPAVVPERQTPPSRLRRALRRLLRLDGSPGLPPDPVPSRVECEILGILDALDF